MLSFLLAVLCVICVLEWFLNRRPRAQEYRKIPGLQLRFLFANAIEVVSTPTQSFLNLRKWATTHKDIYRQWIYPFGIINIYNPQDVEMLLSNSKFNQKSIVYDFLRPWLRDGLLLSDGSKWLTRRKILTPAFHFNILQKFATVLEENSWRLVNKLDDETKIQKTDIIPLMSDTTLNSICETAMGTKLDDDGSKEGHTYKKAIYNIGETIIHRSSRIWLIPDITFNLSNAGKTQRELLKYINDFPKSVIEDRRQYINKHGFKMPTDDMSEEEFMGPRKRRLAMLDLLLAAEKEGLIDEIGIQEEVDTFMFEGHDTTSMGLTYAFMELANNKDIQDKVVEELKAIFGDSSRWATMQDMAQMKYLECCIKETLRLYPPVPFISRKINARVTLGGYSVPPGTICHIHIFDLHRRSDLYEDPLVFKPERFTAENCVGRHPYAYIPFSGGPRNCIGQKFAMLELKSVLSAVLRRYQLLPVTKPEDLVFSTDLVLRTNHPVYVNFVKRV